MAPPNRLDDFLRQVFAFIVRKLGEKVDRETALRTAQRILEEMRLRECPISWENAPSVTIQAAKRRDLVGIPVRLCGSIVQLQDPQVISVPDENGAWCDVETSCVELEDHFSNRVSGLDITGADLIDTLQQIREQRSVAEFLGLMLLLPSKLNAKVPDTCSGDNRREFVFRVVDARPSTSAFDLLGATQDEREQALESVNGLRDAGTTPLEYLLAQVIQGLGIVGLDELPVLNLALEFTVLQAVSTGWIRNSPAKLHGQIVGPPGQGKKLPLLAASALNPAAQIISSSKCSPAGLVGASCHTGSGWRSTPGAIPRAAHGVILMQDAHGWSPADVRQMAPILQSLMEDGVVHDTVAGGRSWAAPVSVLIDMNRTSHVDPGTARRPEAALLRVLPLLSRMDAVFEIPVNAERAWAAAAKTYTNLHGATRPVLTEPWVRHAKLLVAALRHEIPTVSMTGVRALMEAAHSEVYEQNHQLFSEAPTEATALPMRFAVSFARLVVASARSQGRAIAAPTDVERALRFLTSKLSFMKLRSVPLSDCTSNFRGERGDFLRRHAGTEVRPDALAELYEDETGAGVSEKTIRRDLERLGALRVKKGLYLLPPGED